jgi:hypothetical protein
MRIRGTETAWIGHGHQKRKLCSKGRQDVTGKAQRFTYRPSGQDSSGEVGPRLFGSLPGAGPKLAPRLLAWVLALNSSPTS